MAFGNLNLGNLATALQATGANPALAEGLREAAPVAPPKAAPSVIPANANAALEATGSAYRVPAEPPATDQQLLGAVPTPAPEAPRVSEKAFDHTLGTKALKAESTAGKNEQLQSITDLANIRSEGSDKAVRAMADLEDERRYRTTLAEGRVDEERDTRKAQEKAAFERLDKANALIDEPPDTSKGAVLRAIGAMLSMGGNGGIGAGMQMLGQSMAGDIGEWRAKIAAQQSAQQGHLAMAGNARENVDHELRTEKALGDLAFANTDLALKRFAEETKNAEQKEAAISARAELRNKYVDAQVQTNEALEKAQKAAAAKAAAKAAKTEIYRYIAAGATPQERAARAAFHGETGTEALKDLEQNEKSFVDLDQARASVTKTQADTAKTEAETAKTAAEVALGPQAKMSDGDKKLARLAAGVKPAHEALSKLSQQIATGKANVPFVGIGPTATTWFASEKTQGINGNIQQIANVLLRDETGANMPADEQATKWRSWGLDSPDQAVRNRGLAKMLAEYEGRIGAFPQGAASAAPAAAPETVTMTAPSGRVVQIPKTGVENALANKYTMGSAAPAPAPAPAAAPNLTNAAYEDEARRSSGY